MSDDEEEMTQEQIDEALAKRKARPKLRHGGNTVATQELKPAAKLKPSQDFPVEDEADDRAGARERLEDYLRECVHIDPLNLNDEFCRVSGDLAHWNAKYAKALRAFLTAKVDIDIQRARLEPVLRNIIAATGVKPTAAQVEAQIEAHEDIIALKYRVVDTEVEKNEVYGALDAIRSKKEMLVSLGAHIRAELGGDPALRDRTQHANRGRGSSD